MSADSKQIQPFGFGPSKLTDAILLTSELMGIATRASSLESADRTGGHLVIMNANDGHIALSVTLGELTVDQAERFHTNAHEKAGRLRERMFSHGHIFSRQSRNPAANQYGGAALAGDWILSFSGFPETVDEALMVVLGMKLYLYDDGLDLSDPPLAENPHIKSLFAAWESEHKDATPPT